MIRTSGTSPVCLVDLVCFIYLVHLVYLVSLVQPNRQDKPNKPNNGLLTLADFFSILLLNARLALQPPHILHDLIDILRSDAVDLRHVAEFPMVRLDAVGCRQLEGLIPVMVRLVDLMH
jgi:hypothetical protein